MAVMKPCRRAIAIEAAGGFAIDKNNEPLQPHSRQRFFGSTTEF
jgi:hypothetical protein